MNKTKVIREFRRLVNISSHQMEDWLKSDEYKLVNLHNPENGYHSGYEVIRLMNKSSREYTDKDIEYMQTIVQFIQEQKKQFPKKTDEELAYSPWRFTLISFGHDPLK